MAYRLKCVECGDIYHLDTLEEAEVTSECDCGGKLRRLKRKRPADNRERSGNPSRSKTSSASSNRKTLLSRDNPIFQFVQKATDRVVGILCVAYGGVAALAWLVTAIVFLIGAESLYQGVRMYECRRRLGSVHECGGCFRCI